jgi:hypothetical protein
MSDRPSLGELWHVAYAEHGNAEEKRRERYRELLLEHGHLVERKPGDDPNLPCGWPS